jgi:hypothetical protein
MTADPNDLVRVTAGSLTQVQTWHDVLRAAEIESRVVGDNLTSAAERLKRDQRETGGPSDARVAAN